MHLPSPCVRLCDLARDLIAHHPGEHSPPLYAPSVRERAGWHACPWHLHSCPWQRLQIVSIGYQEVTSIFHIDRTLATAAAGMCSLQHTAPTALAMYLGHTLDGQTTGEVYLLQR